MTDLTIATVLWEGDFRKRTYSAEWVKKMENMVKKVAPYHKFVCLSNVPVHCERIELTGELQGWWAKLELFKPDNGLTGRVLYLDLDTLPIKALDDIINHSDPIRFMPPSYTFVGGKPAGGHGVFDRYQTSCMSFDAGAIPHVYTDYTETVRETFRGDQDWIGYTSPGYATFNPKWFRKLKQCQKGPPPGVKLVLSMPWKNDVAAKRFPWVGALWK